MPTSKNASVDLVGKNIRCSLAFLNRRHRDLVVSSIQCFIRKKKVSEAKDHSEKPLIPLEVSFSPVPNVLRGHPTRFCVSNITFIFEKFAIETNEYLALELKIEGEVRQFEIDAHDIHAAKDWSSYVLVFPPENYNFQDN